MSEKPALPDRPGRPGRPQVLQKQEAAAAKKPDEVQETPEQKQYRRRRQVASEVLTTEVSYCTSLAALVDIAIPILKDAISDEELKLLFSNIATILQFNQNFCANLDQCMKCWTDESGLGSTFLTFTPYLKMYTQYVSNHEAATNFERELSQQARFLRVQEKIFQNPRMAGSSSLANFLIMPIQRIPRYSLLLTELIKTTPETHVDLPLLKKALEQTNEVAHKVNAEITAQQNRQMVYEKTQMLGLDEARFVQPSRFFVKQGQMIKVCRSKDTTYEFFLFNDVLIYASKITGLGKFKVHQEIPIDSSFCIQDAKDDDKRSNQFKIINSIKSFAVYTENPQLKAEWMKILTELIQKAKSKIQRDEDAGIIVPVWTPDDQANKCLCCSTEFTFFNRKHHCRFCGGVVCGACSKRKAFQGQGKKEERICDQCVNTRTKFSQMQQSDGPFSGRDTEIVPVAIAAAAAPTATTPAESTQHSAPPQAKMEIPTFESDPERFKPTPLRFHALQSNSVKDVGDLPFQQGDTIMVYYRAPDGWWTGTNATGDERGIFESTRVTATGDAEPVNQPLNASLIIEEQPENAPPGAPKHLIAYQSGHIVIVMYQLNDWSLVYNLNSGSMGWLPSKSIVALNSTDEEQQQPPPTPVPATPVPTIQPPSMPTPALPAPTPPEVALPSMSLPSLPPATPVPATPASPRSLPPPSGPPPGPRALAPPSGPPPQPIPASTSNPPPQPVPVASNPPPMIQPASPTHNNPPSSPTNTNATLKVPPPANTATLRGPPPAASPPANNATLRGPPPAATAPGAAAPAKFEGALPKGACNNCKCEGFRSILKKTVCVDCGHGAADHKP